MVKMRRKKQTNNISRLA